MESDTHSSYQSSFAGQYEEDFFNTTILGYISSELQDKQLRTYFFFFFLGGGQIMQALRYVILDRMTYLCGMHPGHTGNIYGQQHN